MLVKPFFGKHSEPGKVDGARNRFPGRIPCCDTPDLIAVCRNRAKHGVTRGTMLVERAFVQTVIELNAGSGIANAHR